MLRSQKASQNLASGPMSESFQFNEHEKSSLLKTVYVHASVPITEDVSIYFESDKGTDYDVLIDAQSLNANSDYVFSIDSSIAINYTDKIRVEVTNANEVGEVFVTVKSEFRNV